MAKRIFSAPTVVNLEITEACNVKCRHCYNPWRDESAGKFSLDVENIDRLADMFAEAGVFHVVLSGGEPLAKPKMLEYALGKMTGLGMSVSCNSNLMLATPEKVGRLRALGLDHILTSWCSSDPTEMDYIMGQVGAYEQVVNGIRTTVEAGIRVSVNTIVSQNNKTRVYESGKFLHGLGVGKFFAHRVVPPAYDRGDSHGEHHLTPADARETLDELLRLKADTGMIVGTLISYPLCMLGDLEKYADFVGRGCPSQSGHRFSINSNGETHCCVMEDEEYGNVFEIGLRQAYANTRPWHNESYHHEDCEGCHYIDVCESGCRMSALSATGRMNGRDPLMVGKEAFVKPFHFRHDPTVIERIEAGLELTVPADLRLRREDGFHLLNIRWGNTILVEDDIAAVVIKYRDSGDAFTLADLDGVTAETLADLLFKDALEADALDIEDERSTKGVSIDPSKLPRVA